MVSWVDIDVEEWVYKLIVVRVNVPKNGEYIFRPSIWNIYVVVRYLGDVPLSGWSWERERKWN